MKPLDGAAAAVGLAAFVAVGLGCLYALQQVLP